MIIPLLLVPLAVAAGSFLYFRRTITALEFVAQLGLSLAIAIGGWFLLRANSLQSVEHWNGRITAKDKGTEGCCHCTTVCDATDKDGNCTSSHEECDHISDNWWGLDISTGDRIRHGCEGWDRPPDWWAHAKIGEPASIEHTYTNYLKADPESLLHHSANPKDLESLPAFPRVHGKYRVSKVVTHGVARAPSAWQAELMDLNADLGARKQVDVTVVLTSRTDPEWAYAIEAGWLYGPKNALIVVMGTDGSTITWARVVTISDVEELKIELRDSLPGRALDDPDLIADIGRGIEAKLIRGSPSSARSLAPVFVQAVSIRAELAESRCSELGATQGLHDLLGLRTVSQGARELRQKVVPLTPSETEFVAPPHALHDTEAAMLAVAQSRDAGCLLDDPRALRVVGELSDVKVQTTTGLIRALLEQRQASRSLAQTCACGCGLGRCSKSRFKLFPVSEERWDFLSAPFGVPAQRPSALGGVDKSDVVRREQRCFQVACTKAQRIALERPHPRQECQK